MKWYLWMDPTIIIHMFLAWEIKLYFNCKTKKLIKICLIWLSGKSVELWDTLLLEKVGICKKYGKNNSHTYTSFLMKIVVIDPRLSDC